MRPYRAQAPDLIRKRLERGVAEGDVPKGVDLELLVSLYAGLVYGLPVRARDGASRKALLAGVTGAMAAWDQLISPKPRRRMKRRQSRSGARSDGGRPMLAPSAGELTPAVKSVKNDDPDRSPQRRQSDSV
jgi:hypothetical protein